VQAGFPIASGHAPTVGIVVGGARRDVVIRPGELRRSRVSSRVVLSAPRRYVDGTILWPSDHYGVLAELELTTR